MPFHPVVKEQPLLPLSGLGCLTYLIKRKRLLQTRSARVRFTPFVSQSAYLPVVQTGLIDRLQRVETEFARDTEALGVSTVLYRRIGDQVECDGCTDVYPGRMPLWRGAVRAPCSLFHLWYLCTMFDVEVKRVAMRVVSPVPKGLRICRALQQWFCAKS